VSGVGHEIGKGIGIEDLVPVDDLSLTILEFGQQDAVAAGIGIT